MEEEKMIYELKKMRRNAVIYGMGLFIFGNFLLIGILVVFNPVGYLVPLIFVICIGIAIIGVLYLIFVGDTTKGLLRSVRVIKQIEPDELIITKKFVLGRKGKIYLLTKRFTSSGLSFLKFNDLMETNEKKIKIKLPKTKFAKSKKIAGVKVYYSKGRYTIPIGRDKYATGDGIIYSVELETLLPLFFISISHEQKFKKDVLFAIMAELEKEIV